jgi:hypothetical protein
MHPLDTLLVFGGFTLIVCAFALYVHKNSDPTQPDDEKCCCDGRERGKRGRTVLKR